MARHTHTDAALTISDAARLCGVDRRTLRRSIQAGRLTLDAQHCLSREALVAAGYLDARAPLETPHEAPHVTPQETPHELPLVTALLAHLEQLTRTIVALHQEVILLREDLRQTPQRRRSLTPHDAAPIAEMPQDDAAPMPHHDALTPQETPQDVTPVAAVPQTDTAPVPHHEALLPQEDTAPVAAVPQGRPATGKGSLER